MYPRTEYEITEKQLKVLLEAFTSTPCISFDGINSIGKSSQENANIAWHKLGKEMGFDSSTVKPITGKGTRFFTAVASETEEQRKERTKKENQEKINFDINKLKEEILEKQKELDRRTLNLCPKCRYEPPICNSSPKFGCGYGNDNVYECKGFKQRGEK